MNHLIHLPPGSEELAAGQAGLRHQAVDEYLSALAVEALAQRAAEALPEAGSDPLSFWEAEMARQSLELPG